MVTRKWFWAGLLAALAACSTPTGSSQGDSGVEAPDLTIGVEALRVQTVLPGTQAALRGSGFLQGAELQVQLNGRLSGAEVRWTLPATRLDDLTLLVDFPPEVVGPAGEGTLTGDVVVAIALGEARGTARAPVTLTVAQALTPVVGEVPGALFPATPIVLRGAGFIAGAEGRTRIELRGQLVRDRDGEVLDIAASDLVALPPPQAPSEAWARDVARFQLDPELVGIEPGHFTGELRAANDGLAWSREGEWQPVELDLLPPVIDRVDPPAASRGQRVSIFGQGFVGDAGVTLLRLDGEFIPREGEATPLPPDGLVLTPVRVAGDELAFSMRVNFDFDCTSSDLGARAGLLSGTVTPITQYGDSEVEGVPLPLTFEVLPTRQVVWLKFLPAFTDSLRLFGLRNVSADVETRIIEVLHRDYTGINLDVRLTEPRDFLEYSVVEIGGPDPNGQNLFGLDNTPDLDQCNERLDDHLAGRNADGAGYGGIFVESFLQLSPRSGSENPLASELFDEIFDPVREQPVEPGEWPDGERAPVIGRAILALGSMIGNTATHEIGHSLGLPVSPGCGEYHTAPAPLQIMDCGGDRPFEERAEIYGERAAFNADDLEYLRLAMPGE